MANTKEATVQGGLRDPLFLFKLGTHCGFKCVKVRLSAFIFARLSAFKNRG